MRTTPINAVKRCHPYPSVLDDVFFVPVILYLASLSGFPLEWRFCPAPGMCRCRCDTLAVLPVGTRLRSLRANPIGEEGYKREVTYRVIKYERMGWVYGTSWMNCTNNVTSFTHPANAATTTGRSPRDHSPTQLGREYDRRCSGDGDLRHARAVGMWL